MRYILSLWHFLLDIYHNRKLLWSLTKKDLKQRYLGSALGVLWAYIQPLITVVILWFVFQVGFKSMPVDNFPFILWLVCGMFPWFLLVDAWGGATGSIVTNSFLVKKVVFRVSLLPIIQIMSAIVINLFFQVLLFALFAVYGFMPNIYNLQIIYYLFCTICLVFGLSLLTSALNVFMKDITHIVSMLIQFGFWGTPIFWSLNMIPNEYHWIFRLNPACYIVEGYRNSFIYHQWFWEQGYLTPVFWITTLFIILCGFMLFKKLRPYFADVL